MVTESVLIGKEVSSTRSGSLIGRVLCELIDHQHHRAQNKGDKCVLGIDVLRNSEICSTINKYTNIYITNESQSYCAQIKCALV